MIVDKDTPGAPYTENPKPLWQERIEPLESLSGENALRFEYQHQHPADSPKTIMEMRASEVYSVIDDCQGIVFGLWEIQDGKYIPVGVLYGLVYRNKQVNDFISGSRDKFRHATKSNKDQELLPKEFWMLDDIYPHGQTGSDDAFEIAERWRDGTLSQIFLGAALEVLASHKLNRAIFNDDKTIQKYDGSVYTRTARGKSETGRQATTIISTQLTHSHQKLLEKYIK